MKFTLSFKSPDVFEQFQYMSNIHPNDHEACKAAAEKYVKYGEYVTIEFDTETGDAKVIRS
jgi:UDP-3-O-[3-hydroxymyristoyl] glucosamine N-acyltransferase